VIINYRSYLEKKKKKKSLKTISLKKILGRTESKLRYNITLPQQLCKKIRIQIPDSIITKKQCDDKILDMKR